MLRTAGLVPFIFRKEANYLRINDIEITYSTPEGWGRETFNKNGRVKLYSGGVFKLALPRPMRIKRIRIRINHESTGLEISGIPYHPEGAPRFPRRMRRMDVEHRGQKEVLLGTTPGGSSTWLETLCSNASPRPIREIQLKRTGRKTSYLRINDIEVTYLTPAGKRKEVFNKGGRGQTLLRWDFQTIFSQADDGRQHSYPGQSQIDGIRGIWCLLVFQGARRGYNDIIWAVLPAS